MKTFTEIIQLWPTLTEFAADVGEGRECVKMWELRNSIPAYAFKTIVSAAEKRGFSGVTLQVLCDAAVAAKRVRRAKGDRTAAAA